VPQQLKLDPGVRKFLQKGLEHHRAGRMREAEGCYLHSLKADPRCPQALHLLGLLAQQAGEYLKSILLIEKALALNPDDGDALNSLAESYLGQKLLPQAVRCYQRLVEIRPQSAEAHHRLGKVRERQEDWEGAAASYRRALSLQADSPDLYASLARLECKQGAFEEAVDACRRALALAPHRPELYQQLGHALTYTGNYGGAAQAYRQVLALEPDSARAVYGLGYIFERQGDLAAAADAYRIALKIDPDLAVAYFHLGITHHLQGDCAQALKCVEMMRRVEPDSAEARSFLGILLLQQGNFSQGWSEYEYRWGTTYGLRHRRKFRKPLWKGEPLAGARILLHAEQGMGDTLQFVRYVPLVAARGGSAILEVQPRLHRLLAKTPGAVEVISRGEALPAFDWQCPLLSLPLAFATDLSTIPSPVTYVEPDPAEVEIWRERLGGNGLRVGLAWGGNAKHPHEHWRSIPLELLAPLTRMEGATFYSLQMGPPAARVAQLGVNVRLVDLQGEQKDFADTAAIVSNLDLVISIDTSVAHLAGAMGKPVWVFLSKSPDWRWMLDREDTPWYPSARLYRQSRLGNWAEVISRVERDLTELAAKTAACLK